MGIYVIRDEFDTRTLYVGKANLTKKTSIKGRLTKHLRGEGNPGIADLVKNQQSFTVRWAESQNPGLAEGIAIAKLSPLFNKKCEWADIKGADEITKLSEVGRLGLWRPERPEPVPTTKAQPSVEQVAAWMEKYNPNKVEEAAMQQGKAPFRKLPVEQEHLYEYPTEVRQDKIQELRGLLPESDHAFQIKDSSIDSPTPDRK